MISPSMKFELAIIQLTVIMVVATLLTYKDISHRSCLLTKDRSVYMVEVYIDGASAGDPGPSGAGIFIKNDGDTQFYSIPLGIMNNHEAEYIALIKSLEICLDKGYATISVRTDSAAVVGAMEKEYAKKEPYRKLLVEALNLASKFDLFFIKWIPSKENKNADELARKALRVKGKD